MEERATDEPELEYGLSLPIERVCDEMVVVHELLQLDGKDLLDLGCGPADKSRTLAAQGTDRRLLAVEIDPIQHARNLALAPLPNVRFAHGGAEAIPAEDGSFDVVFLFKSLHHVPVAAMDRALVEIARVLRPGGFAYVSEPLYRDGFNDVLRLFHDEARVRGAAFGAIRTAVRTGVLASVSQTFFRAPLHFADFAAFESQVIRVTHSSFVLTDEQWDAVRAKFTSFAGDDGVRFDQPVRVDLLRKPV